MYIYIYIYIYIYVYIGIPYPWDNSYRVWFGFENLYARIKTQNYLNYPEI